jgi:hypothetical protein
LKGEFEKMSGLKDTVDKIRKLEAEKISLTSEIEELKKTADAKANELANEIAMLREDVKSLKILMGEEQNQQLTFVGDPKKEKLASARELIEKTLDSSSKLGNDAFTSSPYSQYFDNWLANLKQITNDFETNFPFGVDDQFVGDRSQVLLTVESELTQKKLDESKIGEVAAALANNNHLLVEADKEYVEKSRGLSLKKDVEVERLTKRVNELEREILNQEDSKNKIFKKKNVNTPSQAKLDLKSAKDELELAQKNFALEQENLHNDYEKQKQEISARVESLHQELGKLETDTSVEARKVACEGLASAVNALFQRTASIS